MRGCSRASAGSPSSSESSAKSSVGSSKSAAILTLTLVVPRVRVFASGCTSFSRTSGCVPRAIEDLLAFDRFADQTGEVDLRLVDRDDLHGWRMTDALQLYRRDRHPLPLTPCRGRTEVVALASLHPPPARGGQRWGCWPPPRCCLSPSCGICERSARPSSPSAAWIRWADQRRRAPAAAPARVDAQARRIAGPTPKPTCLRRLCIDARQLNGAVHLSPEVPWPELPR